VNTAFITSATDGLSPPSTGETNALLRLIVMRADNSTLTVADLSPPFSPDSGSIAANCLLYASLCCSLLAAMGAMLGKEWLQSYAQSGQAGPTGEQARFRQQKFNGAQKWHLESTIIFLPSLLLLSVILFFVGLIIYLWPIDVRVAGVVTALSALGVALCCAAIIAGAIWPTCPYQTALSRALRRFFRQVRQDDRVSSTAAEDTAQKTTKQDGDDSLNAEAACWLLQTTSDPQDQLTFAQNLYGLGEQGIRVILTSTSFARLISLASEAIHTMLIRRDETSTRLAHVFGTALAYVLRHESDMERLKSIRAELSLPSTFDPERGVRIFLRVMRDEISFPWPNMPYQMKLVLLHTWLISKHVLPWPEFDTFLSSEYDDVLLGMIAYYVCQHLTRTRIHYVRGFNEATSPPLDWNDYSGKMLLPNLLAACSPGPRAWARIEPGTSVIYLEAVYGAFLERIQRAIPLEDVPNGLRQEFGPALEAGLGDIFQTPALALWKEPICQVPLGLRLFKVTVLLSDDNLPPGWDSKSLNTMWKAVNSVVLASRSPDVHADTLIPQVLQWTLKTSQTNVSTVILSRHPRILDYFSSYLTRTISVDGPWNKLLFDNDCALFCDETRSLQTVWLDHGLSNVIIAMLATSKDLLGISRPEKVLDRLHKGSSSHAHKLARDGVVDTLLKLMWEVEEKGVSFDPLWELAQDTLLKRIVQIWMEAAITITWTSSEWLPAMNRHLNHWLRRIEKAEDGTAWHIKDGQVGGIRCDSLLAFLYDIRAKLPPSELAPCDFNGTINRFELLFQQPVTAGPEPHGEE
ncbi:hypothetical protein FRB90_011690, partial [Tulasnella sp. 427]